MCVIIHKPAGIPIEREILDKSITENPDGGGYVASTPGGVVYLDKGFFTNNGLIASLCEFAQAHKTDPNDLNVLFHYRIATAGKVNTLNTHPFFIHEKLVYQTCGEARDIPTMCHNGHMTRLPEIFGIDADDLRIFNDSFLLIRDGLSQMSTKLRFKTLAHLAKGGQKFALMMPNGSVKRFGNFTYHEGMHFSNMWWNITRNRTYYYNTKDGYYTVGKQSRPNSTLPDPMCSHQVTTYIGGEIICEHCGGNLTKYCEHEFIYEEGAMAGICDVCYQEVGIPNSDPNVCEHPRTKRGFYSDKNGDYYASKCQDCGQWLDFSFTIEGKHQELLLDSGEGDATGGVIDD